MIRSSNSLQNFAGFTLDPEKKILWRGDEIVQLPLKAVELLIALIESRGSVVSKDELLEKVWGETFVEESVLSNNVYLLRKSLGANKNLIQTVPRRGYRFVADVHEIESAETIFCEQSAECILIDESIEIDGDRLRDFTDNLPPEILPPATKSKKLYLFTAGICALIAIFLAVGFFYSRQNTIAPVAASAEINNVAVLPFQSLGQTEQGKALSLGLTDALINRLGGLNRFAVRPLSAVQKFSGGETDLLKFGAELKVDAILDGTMQTVDNRLRVNVRMFKVADGKQIWSGSFDEVETDVFKLQDAISTAVAESLNIELSVAERQQFRARPTENRDAYEMYLRGLYHWNQRTADGFKNALGFFEQAAALDPRFAEAHVGIGNVYLGFFDYGLKPASETAPQAKIAIKRALELNPESAEAHDLNGAVAFLFDRDARAAATSFERAIRLKQNDPTAHLRYGFFLTLKGDFAAAERELKIAERLNPTSTIVQTNIGYLYFCARRFDEAEKQLGQIAADNTNFSLPFWYLSGIYYLQNKRPEMMASYVKAVRADGDAELAAQIETEYKRAGERAALKLWRERLENQYRKTYAPPYNIALAAALQQDAEKTLYWLEEAERQNDPWVLQYKYDPEFDFLRNDPRFIQIAEKLRLE